MDDKEYYSLMNRSNSLLIVNQVIKKSKNKQNISETNFSNVLTRQGSADAEMLCEKNNIKGFTE